jgi:hypothetical protein
MNPNTLNALAGRLARVKELYAAALALDAASEAILKERVTVLSKRDELLRTGGDALAMGRELIDLDAAVRMVERRVELTRREQPHRISAWAGTCEAAFHLRVEVRAAEAGRQAILHAERVPAVLQAVKGWNPTPDMEALWLREATRSPGDLLVQAMDAVTPEKTKDFKPAHVATILECAEQVLAMLKHEAAGPVLPGFEEMEPSPSPPA